jgi:dolichol-phosphate hexosyltransferase
MAAEVVSDSAPGLADTSVQASRQWERTSGHDRSHRSDLTANGYADLPELQTPVPAARVPAARVPAVAKPLSLSIIMAAFNEERTIAQAVQEILAIDFPCNIELIVVNDGSTDRTRDLLAEVSDPRVTVLHHEQNRGKGAALRSAVEMAACSYVLPFDADLEYAAEDVARMLEPVVKGRCKVVYGARLFGYNTVYRSYRYAMGNKMLTRLANVLFDACLSDLHTCLKLIPTDLMRGFALTESGFGLDTEITASLLRIGVRPFEVPVSYFGRSHAEGKKITWRDAVACVWILLRIRVARRPNLAGIDQFTTLGPHDRGDEHQLAALNNEGTVDEPGEEYVHIAQ